MSVTFLNNEKYLIHVENIREKKKIHKKKNSITKTKQKKEMNKK